MSADGSVGPADQSIIRHDDATDALVAWCKETLDASETLFDAGTEIARKLGISPKTVEFHRANLLKKYEARSSSQLIALAS